MPQNSKIYPIYKITPLDHYDPVNYRPISILTGIFKNFKHILHSQLSKYMEDNKLFPKFQYGYRKQHNTSQAILDYTDYIAKPISHELITISISLDLSKAFDTVDQTILKQKLYRLRLTVWQNENFVWQTTMSTTH